MKSMEQVKRIEKEKNNIWKYCPYCRFSIYNGKEWIHKEEGNFHKKCWKKYKKTLHNKNRRN